MLIGTLAITGVGIPLTRSASPGSCRRTRSSRAPGPGAPAAASFAFWLLVISALMTCFYSWRLIFMTFFGAPRGDHHAHDHAHESPSTMLIPLGVLAAGSVFAGMIWYKPFFGDHAAMNTFFGIPAHARRRPRGRGAADGGARRRRAGRGGACRGRRRPRRTRGRRRPRARRMPRRRRTAGRRAVFLAAENHVIDEAHHAPAWSRCRRSSRC